MFSRRQMLLCGLVCLFMILGVAYWFFDPMEVSWMPRCLWKVATGTECPGCGSQRMAHALMHGDLVDAWHANAYALCMLPVVAFMVWLEFFRNRYHRLYARVHAPAFIGLLGVSVLVWWIVRNIYFW